MPTIRILFVPGLDDGKFLLTPLMHLWTRNGVWFHPLRADWRDGGSYSDKLERLLAVIDQHLARGDLVALIGASAGGSLVMNAYARRPQLIGAINVCGRLRAGYNVHPSLHRAARTSRAFKDSVHDFERAEERLPMGQRQRVMVLRPLRDGVVPRSTMSLNGARSYTMPMVGHAAGILYAMTVMRPAMVRFLTGLAASRLATEPKGTPRGHTAAQTAQRYRRSTSGSR